MASRSQRLRAPIASAGLMVVTVVAVHATTTIEAHFLFFIEELLARADTAMYAAKRAGRRHVTWSPGLGDDEPR